MRMKKTIYIIVGCISVVLGIIGIFVPGLPTTPFLLLSSWLFYNSSKRLHDALHRSKWLGPYLRRFQERKGVGWKTKAVSIVCMWTMISISAFVAFENWHEWFAVQRFDRLLEMNQSLAEQLEDEQEKDEENNTTGFVEAFMQKLETRKIYNIPTGEINANSICEQNPGY